MSDDETFEKLPKTDASLNALELDETRLIDAQEFAKWVLDQVFELVQIGSLVGKFVRRRAREIEPLIARLGAKASEDFGAAQVVRLSLFGFE